MSKVSLKTWHFLLVFVILGISSNIIWSNESENKTFAVGGSSLVEINGQMFSDSTAGSTCFVLFYTDTESDMCYRMEENLNQLNNVSEGNTRFFKLNIKDYPGEYGRYDISGTPTTIIFKDGLEVDRIMGVVPLFNLLMIYKRNI